MKAGFCTTLVIGFKAVLATTFVVLYASGADAEGLAFGALPIQAASVQSADYCELAFVSGQALPVELAVTLAQQAKGLSGRDLNDPHSMLFVWSQEAPRIFWMKDTDQDLEVGFFGDDLRLFHIEPMRAHTTDYHDSPRPARLALELRAGDFQRLQLGIGSQLAPSGCLASR